MYACLCTCLQANALARAQKQFMLAEMPVQAWIIHMLVGACKLLYIVQHSKQQDTLLIFFF